MTPGPRRILFCMTSAAFLVLPCAAFAEGLAISHDSVACMIAGKFPELQAKLDPVDQVARARVDFHAEGDTHWYYVDMTPGESLFKGVLPKPLKKTKKVHYYIEATDKALVETRTQEYVSKVVDSAGTCADPMKIAGAVASASLRLGVAPGAPGVPSGFASVGIAAAGAGTGAAVAVGAAASGAAAGGGIGTTALVVAGVVAATGATVAVVASGGKPAVKLTGNWVGVAPDGFFWTGYVCPLEDDLLVDLTQSGTSVTGSATLVVRKNNANYALQRGVTCVPVGTRLGPVPLTGSVGQGTVSLSINYQQAAYVLTGPFTATRMSGTWVCTGTCNPQDGGTWAINKQ